MRRQVALLAFVVSVGVGLCHALCYSTVLPPEVVGRFGMIHAAGTAMPRSAMIDGQLTVVIGLAALVSMLAGVVARSPRPWLWLPARQWWLSGEREAATRRDLVARVLVLGTCGQLLAVSVFHRLVRLNLGRAETLGAWWVDVAVFLTAALVWLALLGWRYRASQTAR